jgi:hypothetical protein
MSGYEVIVGNIGTVYSGPRLREALEAYAEYARQSRDLKGCRAYGEDVTMFKDGEIVYQHAGHTQEV